MRVGLFCNMNNNFFSLVRYLRDRGLDAHLLRFKSEDSHFRPECDSVGLEKADFIAELPWARAKYLIRAHPSELREVLDNYTVLVGCGMAPAYFHKAGRIADILIPYGGDITEIPYGTSLRKVGARRWWHNLRAAVHQRKGIAQSRAVITDFRTMGPAFDALNYKGIRRNSYVPIVYDYIDDMKRFFETEETPVVSRIKGIRRKSDFMIFHQSRHIWRSHRDEMSNKGNDRLIRGFHSFVQAEKTCKATLVLIEYGPDVEHSKKLIQELSLEDQVEWFTLCSRSEVLYGLVQSDVAAGQFGFPCSNNGSSQEALVCGTPLIHSRGDDLLPRDERASLYPMHDVSSPEEIAAALTELYRNPDEARRMGAIARDWFKERAVDGFLDDFWSVLDAPRGQ